MKQIVLDRAFEVVCHGLSRVDHTCSISKKSQTDRILTRIVLSNIITDQLEISHETSQRDVLSTVDLLEHLIDTHRILDDVVVIGNFILVDHLDERSETSILAQFVKTLSHEHT